MSPYSVAEAVAKQMPNDKHAYLWIKPSTTIEAIEEFQLTPPFTSAGWACVGKISGKKEYTTKDIVIMTFHIKWIMQMYQSFSATSV